MKKIILPAIALFGLVMTSCDSEDKKDEINTPSSSFQLNADNFQGRIEDGTVTLDATKVYNLAGSLIIEEGADLVIPAGTRIEATGGTASYIAVAQGGQIHVNGTATAPVVMTSGTNAPERGDWGGLVLCGKAPINKGTSAQAEVSDLTYGGSDASDNSGVVEYLRLEYTGATFNSSKEFNGLSCFGVGSGTVIDYVQMVEGNDDGIEFFGGTVTADHLVVTDPTDDAFDWTEGWTGSGTNWYAKMTNGIGHRGIEADNLEADHGAMPIANPTIANVSIVGNGDGTEDDGFKIRRGTKGDFSNIYIKGRNEGIEIDDDATAANLDGGSLTFDGVQFDTCEKAFDINGTDFTTVNDAKAAHANATINEANNNGAGSGANTPAWAQGWTVGL